MAIVTRTHHSAVKPQGGERLERAMVRVWYGGQVSSNSSSAVLKFCDLRLLSLLLAPLCSSVFGNWELHFGEG